VEEENVDEAEWCNETDVNRLLSLVWQRRKASRRPRLPNAIPHRHCQRKLRLFVCACCRLGWSSDLGPQERHAIGIAEAFADGLASTHQLNALRAEAPSWKVRWATSSQPLVRDAAAQVVAFWIDRRVRQRLGLPPGVVTYKGDQEKEAWKAARAREGRFFCDLLRDLVGNPFRPPPALCPDWLAWQGGTVAALARAIYEERSFDQFPVLADALEDAGCDNENIVTHCRGQGPHARGCWLVDLLVGKGARP
jgi:hypothetical protein